MQESNSIDRNRPVKKGDLEVVDTFQDAGTRPIEKGSEILVEESKKNMTTTNLSQGSNNSSTIEDENFSPLD